MVVGGPHDTSPLGLGPNWVTSVGGLPAYIREIAHALIRHGHPESQAVQLAVGTVQRWARGEGHVSAKTRAKAAAALAEWEAKKTAAHALPNARSHTAEEADVTVDLASFDPAKHPRAPKGTGAGGRFVPLSQGSGYTSTGKGAQADRVKTLQRLLNAHGAALKVDGMDGPKTTAALIAYQRAHGLTPDGIYGPKTHRSLTATSTTGRPTKGRVVAMSNSGRFAVVDLAAGPDTATRRQLAAKGQALPGGRFPVTGRVSLAKAVRAVGRAKGSHDAVRRFLIGRAKTLGATDLIPASWNADGSVSLSVEQRARVVASMGNPVSPRLAAARKARR